MEGGGSSSTGDGTVLAQTHHTDRCLFSSLQRCRVKDAQPPAEDAEPDIERMFPYRPDGVCVCVRLVSNVGRA